MEATALVQEPRAGCWDNPTKLHIQVSDVQG